MGKDSKSLEISCYVVGAGAFGIFFRWMQLQLAYNENGLPDRSAWNVLVPLLIVAGAYVFYRFIQKTKKERKYVPEDFYEALANKGKLYQICRWAIGALMILGSAYLFVSCDVDKNAVFLKILSVFGVLTGVAFPLLLEMANRPHAAGNSTLTLLAVLPVFFYAMWLLTSYKQNSINPVTWDYLVEVVTITVSLLAAFRMAGFAYGVPDAGRSMFYCMTGGMLCIMSLSDKRYLAQQIMLASSALMMVMYNWIMVANLRTGEYSVFSGNDSEEEKDEGFERL